MSAQRNKARRLAVEASEAWLDQYEGFEGSVITGYVLIVESVMIGHPPVITWMTGNGTKPEGDASEDEIRHGHTKDVDLGPLPSWRVRGMCGDIISQLDGREAYIQAERLGGESE